MPLVGKVLSGLAEMVVSPTYHECGVYILRRFKVVKPDLDLAISQPEAIANCLEEWAVVFNHYAPNDTMAKRLLADVASSKKPRSNFFGRPLHPKTATALYELVEIVDRNSPPLLLVPNFPLNFNPFFLTRLPLTYSQYTTFAEIFNLRPIQKPESPLTQKDPAFNLVQQDLTHWMELLGMLINRRISVPTRFQRQNGMYVLLSTDRLIQERKTAGLPVSAEIYYDMLAGCPDQNVFEPVLEKVTDRSWSLVHVGFWDFSHPERFEKRKLPGGNNTVMRLAVDYQLRRREDDDA